MTGSQVVPGDLLFLEVEGTRDFHVYVLAEDQKGKAFVLFPSPTFDARNPLAAGRVHRLPGMRDGKPFNWQVTSAGGEESMVVIGSLKPLVELERDKGSDDGDPTNMKPYYKVFAIDERCTTGHELSEGESLLVELAAETLAWAWTHNVNLPAERE